MEPKISVIMPTFNQGKYIERAIQSVISQGYSNLEFIIIDNLSTDETKNIVNKYLSNIDFYIRENDSGQSNAINKGFKLASGTFLTWLNSDDILLPNVLKQISVEYNKNRQIKWFLGNVIWIDKFDQVLLLRKGEKYNEFLAKNYYAFSCGPSSFFKSDLLKLHGYLREDMHYMMDTELWNRFLKNEVRFKRLSSFCWGLRLHEEAKMSGQNFVESEFNDQEHPSHKKKELERNLIINQYPKYNSDLHVKMRYFLLKLISYNYYTSLFYSFKYKGKKINKIFN
jgi:glycosyltransferase involved in cell wall biosynthesis